MCFLTHLHIKTGISSRIFSEIAKYFQLQIPDAVNYQLRQRTQKLFFNKKLFAIV